MKPYMEARMFDGQDRYATLAYPMDDRRWPEMCELLWQALLHRAETYGVDVHHAYAFAVIQPGRSGPYKARLRVRRAEQYRDETHLPY